MASSSNIHSPKRDRPVPDMRQARGGGLVEKKTVNFDGTRIEVSIPKGALVDYMLSFGKPSNA